MKLAVGTKIKFVNEKKRFTVRASNERYSICTYPLNMIVREGGKKYRHEKTVVYTIIDFVKQIRGTENLIFGMGAETDEDCNEMLARLTDKEDPTEISHRNWHWLDIEKVYNS